MWLSLGRCLSAKAGKLLHSNLCDGKSQALHFLEQYETASHRVHGLLFGVSQTMQVVGTFIVTMVIFQLKQFNANVGRC